MGDEFADLWEGGQDSALARRTSVNTGHTAPFAALIGVFRAGWVRQAGTTPWSLIAASLTVHRLTGGRTRHLAASLLRAVITEAACLHKSRSQAQQFRGEAAGGSPRAAVPPARACFSATA